MNWKLIISTLLVIFGFFGYSFVYSNFYKPLSPLVIADFQSKTLYTDSKDLNHTLFVLRSEADISHLTVASACKVQTTFLTSIRSYYFFSLQVSHGCSNGEFFLKDERGILKGSHFSLELKNTIDLFDLYTDYTTPALQKLRDQYAVLKDKYRLFANVETTPANYEYLKKSRVFEEVDYKYQIVSEILEKRPLQYLIPVVGYNLPTKESKLPNAGRPYRASYTFGVHEGWDIDAPLYTPVVAIDDGVIVYTKADFEKADFQELVLGDAVSDDEKIHNLDILRGNQVWIKTMKGDVIFYGHLHDIMPNIKVGMRVTRGTQVGTVGISGVPDDTYTDYHLHFELKKNPLIRSKIGKNTLDDYRRWDWYFKRESKETILAQQYDIFERNE